MYGEVCSRGSRSRSRSQEPRGGEEWINAPEVSDSLALTEIVRRLCFAASLSPALRRQRCYFAGFLASFRAACSLGPSNVVGALKR